MTRIRIYAWLLLIGILLIFARGYAVEHPLYVPPVILDAPIQLLSFPVAILSILFLKEIHALQRKANLKRYNPKAPEIKAMVRRELWVGSSLLLGSFLWVVGGIFLLLQNASLGAYVVVVPFFLLLFPGIIVIMRAYEKRSGDWSPPPWMPSMEGLEESESKEAEK